MPDKKTESKIKHIAIIMDGNRRWAENKHLPSAMGHSQGAKALKKTIKACIKHNIKYVTVYAFSTENWNRHKEEIDFLMSLLFKTINSEMKGFIQNGIKVRFIGALDCLNQNLKDLIKLCEEKTKNNTNLNLQIAFNYGSRNEITNAVKLIAEKVLKNDIAVSDITEEEISNNLYTKDIPDPDLLVRTGGEQRLSNYLLWQSAYSELYITQTLWPDFNESELKKAIKEFNSRNRRFGK